VERRRSCNIQPVYQSELTRKRRRFSTLFLRGYRWLVTARRNFLQRSFEVRESTGIKHLHTGIVLTVEGRNDGRPTRFHHIFRIIEPEAKMVGMNRAGLRSGRNIGKSILEDDRSRKAGRRNDERLNVETPNETAVTHPVAVGRTILLT
jgi:hypothetical protein